MEGPPTDVLSEFDQTQGLLIRFSRRLESYMRDLLKEKGVRLNAVTSRPKPRPSLIEKINRKEAKGKRYEHLTEITDVVGVRIVTYFASDADRAAKIIADVFEVDWNNSEDKLDRLRAEEFGYRSDHYIVSFSQNQCNETGLAEFRGLKAEVQIRTALQNTWAEIEHDQLGYKAESMVSREVRRKLARTAAVLDSVDEELDRIRRLAEKAPLPSIRCEGLAEAIPEFEFSLDPKKLTTGTDLILALNTNLTTILGTEPEVLLVVEDAACALVVRGSLGNGPNTILFRNAFPKYLTKDLRHVRCRVRGVRVCASQLGVASAMAPSQITVAILNGSDDIQGITLFPVAIVLPGLLANVGRIERIESPRNGLLVDVKFTEGFAGSFKTAAQERGTDRLTRCGTRLIAIFSSLPKNAVIWAGLTNVSPRPGFLTDPPMSCHLVKTDANGAGFDSSPFEEQIEIDDSSGRMTRMAKTKATAPMSNFGMAVWEISDSTQPADCARTETTLVFIEYDETELVGLECCISLGPLSMVTVANAFAPIPRFCSRSSSLRIPVKSGRGSLK